MSDVAPVRTTEEVFRDHLELARFGEVVADIERNFAADCVLLTSFGTFLGPAGVREAADLLERQLGQAIYTYQTELCHGEVAFLEWTAEAERASVLDGADTLLIRHGRIQVMTIHYTLHPKTASGNPSST